MSREMKDSGVEWIGKIPVDWNAIKLKDIAVGESGLFMDGDWIESKIIGDNGIRYLTTGNIGSGYYKEQGNGYVEEAIVKSMDCLIAKPGDIVISRLNKPIARACLLPNTNENYIIAVDNVVLRNGDKKFNKEFLIYAMNIDGYNEEANMRARGATMPRISRTMLGGLQTIYPPYIEQNKITNYLNPRVEKINMIISKTKSTIEDYKLLKQSIITEAVTKGLDKNVATKDSGIEWIGEIPVGWIVAPHKYVMYKMKKIKHVYESEDILSLTLNGVIKRDLINPSGKMPATFDGYQKVYKNNLLLCLFDIDVTPRCVGWIPFDGLTSPAYSQFVLRENGYSPYYNYLLRAIDDTKSLLHLSKNLRSSLTETDFGNINTIIPPKEEQITIADYLDKTLPEIDDLILRKQQLLSQLEQYKKSLIYEYVTGKKEVE